ncbi:MAG: class I SAM-dependent methyltransferase [Deltaproteobacteria bacterium]|nr:class I SAM-dependent methyltransferase [Deltaproteobacteria bacterium]
MIDLLSPTSVIDVGCGVGTWLSEFKKNGVAKVLGLDMDYVDKRYLQLDSSEFMECDLVNPPSLDHKWDLAISLEVAEHLPGECADDFVRYLVSLAPAVLFSAAIPLQTGYNHVNLQWPDYWEQKFAEHGYLVIDCIRPRIWNRHEILPWYAQNMLLFVEQTKVNNDLKIRYVFDIAPKEQLCIVHPRIYVNEVRSARNQAYEMISVRKATALLLEACKRTLKHHMSFIKGF